MYTSKLAGYLLVYQFVVILDPQHVMLPVKIPQGVTCLMEVLLISTIAVLMKVMVV